MNRFKTVGREVHRLGRISLRLSLDVMGHELLVQVNSARDLPERFGQGASFVRVQLHKKRQSDRVVTFLFNSSSSNLEPKRTPTTWRSALHQSTLFPTFQEEVKFQLTDMWSELDDYRIFVSVMSVAGEEVDFIGCLSYSFEEVAAGAKPLQWFWLLTKARGLLGNETVAHDEFPSDPAKNVTVSGRRKGSPNEFINGTYVRQEVMEGGRPLYKEQSRGLFLYYHSGRGAWAIGEAIGSNAPFAFVDDRAGTPDCVLRTWLVFSVERAFKSGRSSGLERGSFLPDAAVLCTSQASTKAAAAPARQVSQKVTREMKIDELVRSMSKFLDNLRILDGYYNEIETSLSPEEHEQLFINFPEVLRCTAEWVRLLKMRKQQDPTWAKPVGDMLLRGAQLLSQPLTEFCSKVQHSHEFVAQLAAISPAFADDLVEVQREMQTDIPLTTALTAPAEQVIVIQQIVAFIANATPIFDADREILLQARNAFDNISANVLVEKPRPAFTVSVKYGSRMRTSVRERGSVRHSQIFDPDVMAAILKGDDSTVEMPNTKSPPPTAWKDADGAASVESGRSFASSRAATGTQRHDQGDHEALSLSYSLTEGNADHTPPSTPMPGPQHRSAGPAAAAPRSGNPVSLSRQGTIEEDDENETPEPPPPRRVANTAPSSTSISSSISGASHNTAVSVVPGYASSGDAPLVGAALMQPPRDNPMATSTPPHAASASSAIASLRATSAAATGPLSSNSISSSNTNNTITNSTSTSNPVGGATTGDSRPRWLFPPTTTKEQAEALVGANGTNDGRYLVRERQSHQGNFVLTLAYKGNPTHHLITRDDDGIFRINRRSFGDPRSLPEAITKLQQPQAGWPQILLSAVMPK